LRILLFDQVRVYFDVTVVLLDGKLTDLFSTYIITILLIWFMEMSMKKTTLLIDEKLLREAMETIGARTKKEVVEAGLRSLVRHYNREALRKELGTFEIDLTLEELERLRNAD